MNSYRIAVTFSGVMLVLTCISYSLVAQSGCECSDIPRPKRFALINLNALTKQQQSSTHWLVQALSYPEADKRALALRRLGQSRDQTVVRHIISRLNDSDCLVRTEAVVALGYFKLPEIEPSLISRASDPSCTVREEVAYQLARYPFSDSAKEALRVLAKDGERNVSSQALRSLRNYNDTALIPELQISLMSSESKVREGTIEALSVYRSDSVGGWIREALEKDSSKHVRQAAAYALMRYNSKPVMKVLLKALDDPDEHVQQGAVESLTVIGDISAFEPIAKKLDSKNPVMRHVALIALVKLGDARAIPYLKKGLSDGNKSLQNFAKQALSKMEQ